MKSSSLRGFFKCLLSVRNDQGKKEKEKKKKEKKKNQIYLAQGNSLRPDDIEKYCWSATQT